jgi:REP element-mobilizing transposase RayT
MQHSAGEYYHAFNRGAGHSEIFTNQDDYLFLLKRLKQYLLEYPVTLIAYVLMPNHYHFLVRVEADGMLSPFIQRLFNSYTQAYNRRHNRSGTLFEGRVRYKLIDKEAYLIHVARYIHLNPVKAGLVQHPEDWSFSNYAEWTEKRPGKLFDPVFVREYFTSGKDYENFTLEFQPSEIQNEVTRYISE